MEDEKNHHNNNLLHLKLPSSSSSSSNQLLFTPPDSDTLLSLFNLPTYPLMNNSPFPSLISSHSNHQQSSFMGYGVQDQSAEISPAGSFGNGENHTHPIISNAVMGGKRRKTMLNSSNKGEALAMEKTRDVIHVRAKRGQATDSHSLAERVRREKINEKLKVLQELVPGCYKTMGMAVVLDVIINYVRSLQNQIEFLSMKLSAASMFYDFNSPEAEAMEALQRTNPNEAMERMMMMRDEGFEEGANNAALHPTWPF